MNINSQSPYLSSRLDILAQKLLSISNTNKNDFLLIEPYSIGDAVHTLSILNAFRNKFCLNGEKINLICNPRAVPVAKLFNNVDTIVGMDCHSFEYQFESLAERYGPCPRYAPIPMPPDMYARGWLGRLITRGELNPIDAKRLILEIDDNKTLYRPELNPSNADLAIERAKRYGLVKNSVIIFNHALTIKPLNPEIFRSLKSLFGDNVFYDVHNQNPSPTWAKPIKIDLADIPYVVNFAGFAVSIRSGITDLLSVSNAKLITIYPNSSQIFDTTENKAKLCSAFRFLTLNKLGLDFNDNETPIFFQDTDTAQDLSEKLVNSIKR